jgi:hypothetical protein
MTRTSRRRNGDGWPRSCRPSSPGAARRSTAAARFSRHLLCRTQWRCWKRRPPERTVYHDCWRWRRPGVWQQIQDRLRERVRAAAGREATRAPRWSIVNPYEPVRPEAGAAMTVARRSGGANALFWSIRSAGSYGWGGRPRMGRTGTEHHSYSRLGPNSSGAGAGAGPMAPTPANWKRGPAADGSGVSSGWRWCANRKDRKALRFYRGAGASNGPSLGCVGIDDGGVITSAYPKPRKR